jgi:hypothetical protein
MRFTVHADQHRTSIEFELATVIEAISKAWTLMGAGATGVYIYDDEMDQAYWPHEFSALRPVNIAEAAFPYSDSDMLPE